MKQLTILYRCIIAMYFILIIVGIYLIIHSQLILGILLIGSCIMQMRFFKNTYEKSKAQELPKSSDNNE
jgi:hypothetical protein